MATCKFDIGDGVALSTLKIYKPPPNTTTPYEATYYTLRIRLPLGLDGEPEETIVIAGDDLSSSEDGTRWEYAYLVTRVGTHYYRFEFLVSGGIAAADEKSFVVQSSVFY